MANNRASCGSYLSDEELVIIRLAPASNITSTGSHLIEIFSRDIVLVALYTGAGIIHLT